MRHRVTYLIGLALTATLGCGDGGGGPSPGGDEGARAADRFEELADSVDGEGFSPTAQALRHAAEIVRLAGRATPVTLTVDGTARSFLAVAEQLDFPQLQCWWPADSTGVPPSDTLFVDPAGDPDAPPPPLPVTECMEVGTYSARTLIAWEPERMAEVVRLVADGGSNQVDTTRPDVMTGLPASPAPERTTDPAGDPVPGDTAVGGGGGGGGGDDGVGPGFPGFLGEYLVGDEGMWFAVEGSQSNELVQSGGSCTDDRATFDWAEFECETASFGFEFTMRVQPLRILPAPGGETPPESGGEHAIAMAGTRVDGVRLRVVAWVPPPPPEPGPPPGPVPPDSAVVTR